MEHGLGGGPLSWAAVIFQAKQGPPAVKAGPELCRWLAGRLFAFPWVLELLGGLEQSDLAPY